MMVEGCNHNTFVAVRHKMSGIVKLLFAYAKNKMVHISCAFLCIKSVILWDSIFKI